MSGFTFTHEDGSLAEPHTFSTAVPNWRPGDTIPLGGSRTLRVVEVRPARNRMAIPSWWWRPPDGNVVFRSEHDSAFLRGRQRMTTI